MIPTPPATPPSPHTLPPQPGDHCQWCGTQLGWLTHPNHQILICPHCDHGHQTHNCPLCQQLQNPQ